MNRRIFLHALAALLGTRPGGGADPRAARIVVRSSWQTVNVGDIAHTPGVLALLEQHLPDVEVRLWPSDVGLGEWLFDMDEPADIARIVPAVLQLARDPESARARAAEAREFVRGRQREMTVAMRRV